MITNGRFQILLRRRQNQANYPLPEDPLINVIVVGDPLTGEAKYIPGDVDNTTPFMDIIPVDGWYDFSNFIEDEEKMTFTWDKVNQGDSKNSETSKEGSNYDKGISATLMFFDKGFQFIHDWLLLFDYQIINCVEVKIIDLIARGNLGPDADPAGNYRLFEIKCDNLDYAPIDEPCQLHVKLREQDMIWTCIHKTAIFDDWQGWFNREGTSTFQHPTFLTAIEPRPRLVSSARMALMEFFHGVKTGIFPIALLIDWITDAPTPREDARRIMNLNRFIDAPLIRTYIQNVAIRCGMTTDTIFDENRDWENLCLFFPRGGDMHESEDDAIQSPSQLFHYSNRWIITIPDLFDRLKVVFCAEWYVTPQNKIVFDYKKNLINLAPIYDFTLLGSVAFYQLRYTFNGDKRPAYGEYRYQADPVDEASQEANALYSDNVGFNKQANNPMLEGNVSKNFDFAATGFVRDGRAKDYIKLLLRDGKFGAFILVAIIGIISGAVLLSNLSLITIPLSLAIIAMLFATVTAIATQANKFEDDFLTNDIYTGMVRLTAEQTTVARLLLWDGERLDRAKVVRRTGLPLPFPYYNPTLIPYDVKNKIDKDNAAELIFNYPLYFDGDYYDNLFTRFHDIIDNPLKSKETHSNAHFYVDLCEEMLNLFGVFQDQYAQIGKILKMETRDNYDVFVRIGNILVDYGSNRIEITGQVLRRGIGQPPGAEDPGNIPVPIPDGPGDPTPPPIDPTCLRWSNTGLQPSLVVYRDCNGILVEATIDPAEHFCAFEVQSQNPATIFPSSVCDDPNNPNPEPVCLTFVNIGADEATNVSYIDCDNLIHTGLTIPIGGSVCAIQIIASTCGLLVNAGLCDPLEICTPGCCEFSIISITPIIE